MRNFLACQPNSIKSISNYSMMKKERCNQTTLSDGNHDIALVFGMLIPSKILLRMSEAIFL